MCLLKNARDDLTIIFVFRLNPLADVTEQICLIFFKNSQNNRHNLKSGLKNTRKLGVDWGLTKFIVSYRFFKIFFKPIFFIPSPTDSGNLKKSLSAIYFQS